MVMERGEFLLTQVFNEKVQRRYISEINDWLENSAEECEKNDPSLAEAYRAAAQSNRYAPAYDIVKHICRDKEFIDNDRERIQLMYDQAHFEIGGWNLEDDLKRVDRKNYLKTYEQPQKKSITEHYPSGLGAILGLIIAFIGLCFVSGWVVFFIGVALIIFSLTKGSMEKVGDEYIGHYYQENLGFMDPYDVDKYIRVGWVELDEIGRLVPSKEFREMN